MVRLLSHDEQQTDVGGEGGPMPDEMARREDHRRHLAWRIDIYRSPLLQHSSLNGIVSFSKFL